MCIQAHFMSSPKGILFLVCSERTALWLDNVLMVVLLLLFDCDLWLHVWFALRMVSVLFCFGILPNSRGEGVTGVIMFYFI